MCPQHSSVPAELPAVGITDACKLAWVRFKIPWIDGDPKKGLRTRTFNVVAFIFERYGADASHRQQTICEDVTIPRVALLLS